MPANSLDTFSEPPEKWPAQTRIRAPFPPGSSLSVLPKVKSPSAIHFSGRPLFFVEVIDPGQTGEKRRLCQG